MSGKELESFKNIICMANEFYKDICGYDKKQDKEMEIDLEVCRKSLAKKSEEQKLHEDCEWCVDNLIYHYGEMRSIYDSEDGNDNVLNLRKWKYCPNCGRRLRGI